MPSEVPGKQELFNEHQFPHKGVLFCFETKGLNWLVDYEINLVGCNQRILKTEENKNKITISALHCT